LQYSQTKFARSATSFLNFEETYLDSVIIREADA
jgi:hypothetical protein